MINQSLFADASGAALWPRPMTVPEPESVFGVAQPVISLGGIWKLNATPPTDSFRPKPTP
jgi:hypothetical protein